MTTPGSRPIAYLGVLLLGGGVAVLAATLARVLAFAMGHHLACLLLGMALLGFAAAGSFVTVSRLRRPRRDRPDAVVAGYAFAAAVATPLAYLMASRVVFEPLRVLDEPVNLASLLLLDAILATPFFLAGVAMGSAITFYRRGIGAVSGNALMGAALGVLAVPWLLEPLTGSGLVVAAAGAFAIASACFHGSDCRARGSMPAALRAVAVLAFAALVGWQVLPAAREGRLDPPLVPGKDLAPLVREDAIETTRWSPFARIDVGKEGRAEPLQAGMFAGAAAAHPTRVVFRDGAATSMLVAALPEPGKMDFLLHSTTGTAFVALASRGRRGPEALVLDVGGGVDLQIALAHGATRVTGVDADAMSLDLLRTRYADYVGRLAERPEVELLVDDPRRFARTSGRRFDLIQRTDLGSASALDAAAPRLTLEGIGELLDALRNDGLVCASSRDGSLRVAATAIAALEARGVREAHRHLFGVGGRPMRPWASFLFGPAPFAPSELAALRTYCGENGFEVLFDPEQGTHSEFDACLRVDARARARFFAEYPHDVRPPRDDRPIALALDRWPALFRGGWPGARACLEQVPIGHVVLLLALLQAIALGAIFLIRPLRTLERGAGDGTTRGSLLCFVALGLGFTAFGVALTPHLDRLVGQSLAVLAVPVLLASAGLGALTVTPRSLPRRRLWIVAVSVPLLIAATWWGATHELDAWLDAPLAIRAALAAAGVVPTSFLLGMAFPAAMRVLDARRPELVPWAWAVQAFATVLGATLAVVLAMTAGHSALLLTAASLCIVSLAAFLWTFRRDGDATRSDVVSLEATEGDDAREDQ